jgi:polyisoprenoid-binding protein YceI
MKKVVLSAILIMSFAAGGFAQTWTSDKNHSRLGFAVTHFSISEIDGNFRDFKATINAPNADFSDASVDLSASIASLNTDVEQRDKHLKSPDFFDAEKFPTLTFKSTSFKKITDKKYQLTGNLTLHGVTRPVTLDVVLNGTIVNPQSQKTVAGFKITGSLNRTDFGIASGFPATAVSDDIQILANAEFIKD